MNFIKKHLPATTGILLLAIGMAVVVPDDLTAQPQTPLPRLSKQVLSRRVIKEIIGKDVISIDGKDAGVVFDLVVDSVDGRVGYVVIDHRRNGRLHAMPFELFREEAGKLMVAVEHSKLEPSKGFTKSDWPDMSEVAWGRKIHGFYGNTPYWELPSRRAEDAKDPKDPKDAKDAKNVKDANAKEKPGPKFNENYKWVNRASLMIDIPLKSATGDDLGRVSDLLLDMRNGRGHLVYAIVSGAPGLGDNITLVPFSVMQAKPKEKGFVVNATRDDLLVGSLKESEWKTTADPSWNRRVHRAFNEEPYWNVFGAPEADDDDETDQAFQPGGAYLKNFDARRIRTFTGKVVSTGEFELRPNVKGKQVVIAAGEDNKQYTIHLGPAAHFDKPKSMLSVQVGDQITVRAKAGIIDGKEVYLADQLSKMYELRDSNGRGVWNRSNTDK